MKTNRILLVLTIFSAVNNYAVADPIDPGKTIFATRCAGCHNVNKQLTGPALAGVDERRSIDWIINFVHSSQSMVKKGDKDAVAVYEKFNKIPMPDHTDLKEEDIKNVVAYIKSESKLLEENKAPFAKPGKKQPNYKPLSISDYEFFGTFLFAVVLLISSLLFAVRVDSLRRNGS